MAYSLPQVFIFQEVQLQQNVAGQRRLAHVSGGHAHLVRYDDDDEKADGLLGYYQPALETCYAWEDLTDFPVGGLIDSSYTRVFMDNALLRYFDDAVSAGDSIVTLAGKSNQIKAAATNFKANGTTYPLDSALEERDVQVGDIARVRASVDSESYTLWTYVAGFVADAVAAIVAAATADTDNQETQTAPLPAPSQTAGPYNNLDISDYDQSSYDGLEDGDVNETYTITVIESSVGGDLTTARLRVTSASGNDDQSSVTPSAIGEPTAIGTRGLTVTWDDKDVASLSLSADNAGISDLDFQVGQQWRISVGQAFTAPAATSGGDYSGDLDDTYVIEVTKGGLYADSPQITVTTVKGADVSGPHTVTAADTEIAIGTNEVTVSFDAAGLCKGDKYYIGVTAEADGPYRTLVLGHNLAQEVQDEGGDVEVSLTLYIKKNIEVTEQRSGVPGQYNWTQSATELCLESGITAEDASWTVDGVITALPVESESTKSYGKVYVHYRAWLAELCDNVYTLSEVSDLDTAISGATHPDNPLKWGVFLAKTNAGSSPVKFTSVCDPDDEDSWLTVLSLIAGRRDVYGLVPMTRNLTVLAAYQAHVLSQSGETKNRFRYLWKNLQGNSEKAILNAALTEDGEEVLATLSDDPDTSGTQYTILDVPAGNGQFVTNGVQVGDTVRYLYTSDGFGGATYTEFTVSAVLNEDKLRLSSGHTAAVNVAVKMEVYRTLDADEMVAEIGLKDGVSHRRVSAVWPDEIVAGGYTCAGYFLCAALAGYVSGALPHRSLTNAALSGIDSVPRSSELFNRDQLQDLASHGVWVVTQDPDTGAIFTLDGLTTADVDNLNESKEMFTRNLDDISFFFLDTIEPYLGIANVHEDLITVMRTEFNAAIQGLRGRNRTQLLGGQLLDGTLERLSQHATLKNRIVAKLDLELPFALDHFELYLVAS